MTISENKLKLDTVVSASRQKQEMGQRRYYPATLTSQTVADILAMARTLPNGN